MIHDLGSVRTFDVTKTVSIEVIFMTFLQKCSNARTLAARIHKRRTPEKITSVDMSIVARGLLSKRSHYMMQAWKSARVTTDTGKCRARPGNMIQMWQCEADRVLLEDSHSNQWMAQYSTIARSKHTRIALVALRRTSRRNYASPELYHRATFHSGDMHASYLSLCANEREDVEHLS